MFRLPLLSLLLFSAAAGACHSTAASKGDVDHIVLIWLKDPSDTAARDRIETAAREFVGQIPGLLSVSIGRPLIDGVPDDSYHTALLMNFTDREALKAYEAHPVHVEAAEKVLQPHMERVQVVNVMLR